MMYMIYDVYDLCICITYIKISLLFRIRKYGFCDCINVYSCPLKAPEKRRFSFFSVF